MNFKLLTLWLKTLAKGGFSGEHFGSWKISKGLIINLVSLIFRAELSINIKKKKYCIEADLFYAYRQRPTQSILVRENF